VDTFQAFFLGMMVAWTPGLVILAWLLLRASLRDERGSHHHAD